MATRLGSFPHPVLGNGDDVRSTFIVQRRYASFSPVDTEIGIRLNSDDPDLFNFLEDGTLDLSIWWSSPNSLSSGRIPINEFIPYHQAIEFDVTLLQEDLRGKVTLKPELTAGRDISGFKWTNQHEDYGDTRFNIKKGDYLGFTNKLTFVAQKIYDALNPPLGSLFKVVEKKGQKIPIKNYYGNREQVIINTSSDLAKALQSPLVSDSMKIATVILPALMETLSFIAKGLPQNHINIEDGDDDTGDAGDFEWYKSLEARIYDEKLDINKPLEAAQKLLRRTTILALEDIGKISGGVDDDLN
ncbi:hypothetical protein [Corynebacterium pyruviciproducens]|uniref:hypothetical protein n=1 Tax=Corynebacterium pyruviciproducens TaxID=598660 RepID=UPI0023F2E7BE|nr:hypothetical protein [Corynebacterium pyruviciproducens]